MHMNFVFLRATPPTPMNAILLLSLPFFGYEQCHFAKEFGKNATPLFAIAICYTPTKSIHQVAFCQILRHIWWNFLRLPNTRGKWLYECGTHYDKNSAINGKAECAAIQSWRWLLLLLSHFLLWPFKLPLSPQNDYICHSCRIIKPINQFQVALQYSTIDGNQSEKDTKRISQKITTYHCTNNAVLINKHLYSLPKNSNSSSHLAKTIP